MRSKPQFHGSDLELIEKYYGIPKDKIISFSSNVNPLGISPLFRESLIQNVNAVSAYPDRDYVSLRQAIGAYCGADCEKIIVGSGATELISSFIKSLLPRKAMLINPTYSEYSREILLNGGEIVSFALDPEKDFRLDPDEVLAQLDESFDLLILCNPNNPTGSAVRQESLSRLAEGCLEKNILIMIDETYAEFAEDLDRITAIPLTEKYDNLYVLRGVSKFFSAPGLRLGYSVTGNDALRAKISESKDPWSVNALAATAGAAMFRDTTYIERAKDFAKTERARLYSALQALPNLRVYKPSANFILMKILKKDVTSEMVFERAIKDGLMLRDCSSFPGLGNDHIRFCFCLPEQNDRLIAKIREMIS